MKSQNQIACLSKYISLTVLLLIVGCTKQILLTNSVKSNKNGLGKKRGSVCLYELNDKREKDKIGHVQNLYGKSIGNVVSINDVSKWINFEIENRLKEKGYKVDFPCKNLGSHDITLKGNILKVYATCYFNYVSEVTIDANIFLNKKCIITKTYTGYHKYKNKGSSIKNTFSIVLEKSLDLMVSQLITDIDSLEERLNKDISSDSLLLTENGNNKVVDSVDTSIIEKVDSFSEPNKLLCEPGYGKISNIVGNRKKGDVLPILSKMKRKVYSFYNGRAELNSSLTGDVCLYFEINTKGEVKNIKIIKNSLNDELVEKELIKEIKKVKFALDKKKPNKNTSVTYNLKFNQADSQGPKFMLGVVYLGALLCCIFLIPKLFV